MRKIYCLKYGSLITPYYGYVKPWNGVRDDETWSLTYMLPSFFDGLKDTYHFKENIVRHKLTFSLNGMSKEQNLTYVPVKSKKEVKEQNIHIRHELVNPELILGFSNKEDAEYMLTQSIYFGQNIYIIDPIFFDKDNKINILEMTDEEFDKLPGVETFLCEKDTPNSFYCGNNRQKNNERMYITIDRNEW